MPKVDPNTPGYGRLFKQARDLESVFLNTLTKEMFSSIKTDEQSFGGGFAEETWRSMQAEQFSMALANQGGIGLAEQLMPTLLSLQEAQPTGTGVHS
jgi:Rod binding domain-containing protein